MSARVNAAHLVLKVVVYVSLYFATAFVLGPLLYWLGGYIVSITATGLLAAVFSNSLCLRIYVHRGIAAIGLQGDKAALVNLGFGCLGGVGAAALVLAGPLFFRAARIQADPANPFSLSSFFFVSVLLLFGSAGEELLFRGFGFQVLLPTLGAWPTILPVGIVFALLHAANPNATWLGLANTAGFGILFGYAFLRSHDIWLPIGLHFGWNFTLPLFGVNVSGLTMRLTGFTERWSAGTLWSGGEYGPEASILTSAVLLLLFAYLWKAPIRRQPSALLDPPAGDVTCVPGQPFSPSS
ncbi:MAG: type II CAAX endopeptidase family protein [Bryobacteraceae bacterium]|jgi:membrane protease YdiL (CAAX protease family)